MGTTKQHPMEIFYGVTMYLAVYVKVESSRLERIKIRKLYGATDFAEYSRYRT